jgi:hypothetical protein
MTERLESIPPEHLLDAAKAIRTLRKDAELVHRRYLARSAFDSDKASFLAGVMAGLYAAYFEFEKRQPPESGDSGGQGIRPV